MSYSPQLNAANPALNGQSAASGPLQSTAVSNPAMTSPMAGQDPMASQPLSPALGAFQGSVATPGGSQTLPPQGAFAFAPNMMSPGMQTAMANGLPPAGVGAFGSMAPSGPSGGARS